MQTSTWTWLRQIVAAGSVATLSYVLLIFLSGPGGLAVGVAFVFSVGLSGGSLAIWRLLEELDASPYLGLPAAVANVVAGALFVAMVCTQLAIKDVADPPGSELRAVYWGLDVAWDLYLGAGTALFAIALAKTRFRVLAAPGLIVAVLLLALNLATFPEPPASAGLADVGPLVGLWYTAVTVRAFFLLRQASAQAGATG